MLIRKKEQKFNSVILTDPDYILRNAWGLGECNDMSVCVIVNKKRQVVYYFKGAMSQAEIHKALAAIRKALAEKQ
jgi:predicted transcriptional regulator